MDLSPVQISLVRSILDQSQLTLPTLRDDVLDHLCCLIEHRMKCGETFEISLHKALQQLAPKGLDEIQHETNFLLSSNNFIPMKKLMYSIGLATSMSITMGLMMKLLHMPGGEELINYGFLGFALLFLPLITVSRYRTNPDMVSHAKLKMLFGILSAICTGLAVLFKMTMNLDEATMMLMAGASIFSFGFLPLHFFGMYKRSTFYKRSA